MDPSVLRILVDDQTPHLPRERPEVIQPVPGGRSDRVIPGREQHRIAIAHHVRDRFAAGRIQHLHAEPVRRIDAEVVDLLELRLAAVTVVATPAGRYAAVARSLNTSRRPTPQCSPPASILPAPSSSTSTVSSSRL